MTPPGPGARRPRWWPWPAIGVVVVIGAVLLAVGLGVQTRASDSPGAAPRTSSATTAGTGPTGTALVVSTASVPDRLTIPRLGLSVGLGTLGLNADATVQVPATADQAGWFRLGPTPGRIGSAVVLGHVDSFRGPGVFFQLRSLEPGDQVDVLLADGVVAHFTVTTLSTYPKQAFPAQEVYGSHGASQLQLVTCGGAFDSGTGSYLSNVVVYSTLTGTTPASASSVVPVGSKA